MELEIQKFSSVKSKYYSIPNTEEYNTLRQFIDKHSTAWKQSRIHITGVNTNIPSYIKTRYSNITIPKHGEKSLMIEIREILTKLSPSNLKEMINEFNKYDLSYDIYDLVGLIYEFTIDLIYQIDVYIELIKVLRIKYPTSYDQLIEKVIYSSYNFPDFPDKKKQLRYIKNNGIFLGKLYNYDMISKLKFNEIMNFYKTEISKNIEIFLEIFKTLDLCKLNEEETDKYFNFLEKLSNDVIFEQRIITIINTIIDEKFS